MLMRHLLQLQEQQECVLVSKMDASGGGAEGEEGTSGGGRLVHFQLVSRLFGMLKKKKNLKADGHKGNLMLQMLSTEDVLEGNVSLALASEDIPPGAALSLAQSAHSLSTVAPGQQESTFTDLDWLMP